MHGEDMTEPVSKLGMVRSRVDDVEPCSQNSIVIIVINSIIMMNIVRREQQRRTQCSSIVPRRAGSLWMHPLARRPVSLLTLSALCLALHCSVSAPAVQARPDP